MQQLINFVATLAIAITGATAAEAQPSDKPKNEATFRCDSAASNECHFVLYSSICKEDASINGKTSLQCTQAFLQEFTLKVGESKKVSGLPAGFKQCPVAPNQTAAFPSCAK